MFRWVCVIKGNLPRKWVLICLLVCLCSGCGQYGNRGTAGKDILLGVGSFLQSPYSAWYAIQQVAQESADGLFAHGTAPDGQQTASSANANATVDVLPDSALLTANLAPAAFASVPNPSTPTDMSAFLGAVPLIPDTGAPEGTGTVMEQYYPNGAGQWYLPLSAGTLRNMTDMNNSTVQTAMTAEFPFVIELNSTDPQVLIMHTHATETYRLYEGLYYDLDDTARTTQKQYSVCAVGDVMTQVLNDAGICTLHDTTLNDYPSYNDSYDNSRAVVMSYLEQYPSIKVVIDVHRDALEGDGVRYAPVSEINGTKSAQVMLIAGCDSDETNNVPGWEKNLAFAAAWQADMEGTYQGLTRSAMLMFKYRHYNQDLSAGSLLLEVGGHGNTLHEALYAGQYAAQSLANLLTSQAVS